MLHLKDKLEETVAAIRTITSPTPKIGIVLGTGLGSLEKKLENTTVISYKDIPHFPVSTVASHAGKLVFGKLDGVDVALVSGRFHYYEGYSMEALSYYIPVLQKLGVGTMIFTNAAGAVNPHYQAGDIVAIEDHINFFPMNPLRGPNDESLGPRFPDLSLTYDSNILKTAQDLASELGIAIRKGVYFGWQGPSLETPAEYRMIHRLGADMVGMSTIPEVLVAKYLGMRIAAFSIISNVSFPKSVIRETTLDEVIEVVNGASGKLNQLLSSLLPKL